jgi:hypothetical protein
MPDISLSIVRAGSPPPWEDIATGGLPFTDLGESWKVAVLERGMRSGDPSVALRLDLPDGRILIAQTSVAAWIAATAAMRGAFPEAFAGGPLAAGQP